MGPWSIYIKCLWFWLTHICRLKATGGYICGCRRPSKANFSRSTKVWYFAICSIVPSLQLRYGSKMTSSQEICVESLDGRRRSAHRPFLLGLSRSATSSVVVVGGPTGAPATGVESSSSATLEGRTELVILLSISTNLSCVMVSSSLPSNNVGNPVYRNHYLSEPVSEPPSLLRSFIPLLHHSFAPSLLRSFAPSLLRSFAPSLLRSFNRMLHWIIAMLSSSQHCSPIAANFHYPVKFPYPAHGTICSRREMRIQRTGGRFSNSLFTSHLDRSYNPPEYVSLIQN